MSQCPALTEECNKYIREYITLYRSLLLPTTVYIVYYTVAGDVAVGLFCTFKKPL